MGRAWVLLLRPKQVKTQPSAGKVMATVFWDAKGLLCWTLYSRISKGVLMQQDNAIVHICKVAMDAVE